MGTDGDEVKTILGVVVAFEPDRSTMMNIGIVFHVLPLDCDFKGAIPDKLERYMCRFKGKLTYLALFMPKSSQIFVLNEVFDFLVKSWLGRIGRLYLVSSLHWFLDLCRFCLLELVCPCCLFR